MLLVAGLERIATIHGDRLTVEVLAIGDEHDRLSHVSVFARAPGRKALLFLFWHLRLLGFIATLLCGHLTGEDTRCDAVDANLDAVLRDFGCEHLVDVDCRTFAGIVGEVVLRDADVARNGGDVYNRGRPAVCLLGSLCEKRKEGSSLGLSAAELW